MATIYRSDEIEKRLQAMPKAHRGKYRRAVSGRSLRLAVDAFCLECVGWVYEQVRQCSDLACPLYPYRRTSPKERCPTRERIRKL